MAYEPLPRWGHFSSLVEGKLFMFGGRVEDFHNHRDELKTTINGFDVFHETWSSFHAGGSPPLGIYVGASTALSKNVYCYGGTYSDSGSLHKWDSSTMSWNQLKEHDNKGPIKKLRCAMISHNEEIVLFGGRGIPTGPIQQGSKFIVDNKFTDGRGWTNELHSFNLQEGTWSSPTVTGTRPPPCSEFTLTKINENTAVMFGGALPGHKRTNGVYILDLIEMHWSKLVHKEGEPCPVARAGHDSVCLGYGGDHPELLITGGGDDNRKVLSDMWILNLQSKKWREIKVPSLQSRYYHTADVFHFNAKLAEVILFGGIPEIYKSHKIDADFPMIAQTTVLRFKCVDDEWTLIDVCKFPDLGSPERVKMKEELKQQFMQSPSLSGNEPGTSLAASTTNVGASTSPQVPSPGKTYQEILAMIDNTDLGIDDIGEVFNEVEDLSPDWDLLAIKLHLRNHTIEDIQKNCCDSKRRLCGALKEWLKLNYNHQKYGRPSWQRLAEAVRSLDYGLFEEIARNHETQDL